MAMASQAATFASDSQAEYDAPVRGLSEPPEHMTGSSMSWGSIPSLRPKSGVWNMARRTLGISLLLVTVFLWTASNFLASYIFSDHTYDKPFFLVYINTSMFALSMIPISIKYVIQNGGFTRVKNQAIQEWRVKYRGVEGLKTQEEEDITVGERLLVDDEGSLDAADLPRPSDKLSFLETAKYSLEFSMIWFLGNYFASACLEYTSVGSVTILTSTSSIWTLIFCAVMRIEPFSIRKLVGVLASLAGIVLISTMDLSGADNDEHRGNFPHKSQQQIAIGDSMAFFSAVVYGLYVVVMKVRIGNEERVNMPLFFGLLGVFNVILLWPLFFILHFTGIETFELPPNGNIWAIIMLNSVSSFISDMSWAYAMLLTTPLVVTVGLSLTIPLSLIGEMIQYAQYSSFVYWIGAAIVLVSFIFINHESQEDEEGVKASSDRGSRLAEP
ncbi:hypothetical protein F4820DRAFT_35977 [Hypoxylon rubiginosum]|uniref:Uncharacterized protein n=1 Tax=Hypoxylon rubiginosum TaxID=110542 RepID=A0ACB9YSF9_9PEZI|nr:hypothetical protein F4820DRAFT_35977 [Hypoxylon rubiginosum]